MAESPAKQGQAGSGCFGSFPARLGDAATEQIACRRCREQKLRCSKEKPTCKRCQRVEAVCTYPPLPDRKLLAGLRVQNNKRRRESGTDKCREQQTATSTTGLPPPLPTEVPSPRMSFLLIEAFFSHHWNAELMFHKPSFISDYKERRLPAFLLLSVIALASNFLREPSQLPRIDEDSSNVDDWQQTAEYSRTHAREWAVAAGQQVLAQTDKPSLEGIQACQHLSFYWFYAGDTDRAHFYTTTAYRACRMLRFHCRPTYGEETKSLAAEIKRRCFWSCWMVNCISQGNANFKAESWKEAAGLPLPSDQASFLAGEPEPREFFTEDGMIRPINGETDTITPASAMACLVKVFGLWWNIQNFVKRHIDSPHHTTLQRAAEFLALDRCLENFIENLHPEFRNLMPSNSILNTHTKPHLVFTLQCVYNLCVCVLHSSIVPIFSGIKSDPQMPKRFLQGSAEVAIKHATNITHAAANFQDTSDDVSQLPGITGYALFVSCSLQFKYLSAHGKLQCLGSGHCNASIWLLQRLKEYSCPLQRMWNSLALLFSSANINIEINFEDAQMVRTFGQIVSHGTTSHNPVGNIDLYTYVADIETVGTNGTASTERVPIPSGNPKAPMKNVMGKETSTAIHTDFSLKRSIGAHSSYHPSGTSKTLHGLSMHPHAVGCHCCSDFGRVSSSNTAHQIYPPATEIMQMSDLTANTDHQLPTQGHGQEHVHLQHVESVSREKVTIDNWWDQSLNEFETDIFTLLYGGYAGLDGKNPFPYQ